MNTQGKINHFPWTILLWWILANFVGVALVIIFLYLVDFLISRTGDYAKYIEPHLFPAPGFLVGLSLGLAIGFSQSLVIKKYLKNPVTTQPSWSRGAEAACSVHGSPAG